jgi:ABC-type glycerol-3-phosphate transport system substrate-binding protein
VMWIWQNGGDVLSPDGTHASGYLDGPKSVEAIQFLTDLERKWHVSPSTSQQQALGDMNFEAGRVPIMVSGHWAIQAFLANENLRFSDIGVVGLPRRAKRVTVIYESGPAMMKACRHPREAWEYIKFMSGPFAQRQAAETGIAVSANRQVAEEFRGRSAQEPAFLDNIRYARGPWGATVEQYALVEDIGKEAIEEIRLGTATPQDALTRAAKRIDVQLGEE